MLRRLGVSFFLAVGAAVLILVISYLADTWNWFLSIVGVVLLSAMAFVLFVYIGRRRAAEGFFDKDNWPTVIFEFNDNCVRTESVLGSVDMKWQAFDEILKFPDLWLLVYAKSGYMTLPLDRLTPECRDFIETKIGSPFRSGRR